MNVQKTAPTASETKLYDGHRCQFAKFWISYLQSVISCKGSENLEKSVCLCGKGRFLNMTHQC